jgi:hypothetical protein
VFDPRGAKPESAESPSRPKQEKATAGRSKAPRKEKRNVPRPPEMADDGWNGPVPGFLNNSVTT